MSIISAENLTKTFGEKVILNDTSFYLEQYDKIGIVGVNGTGKTTFLNILAGKEHLDSGQVVFKNGLKVSFLEQDPVLDESLTILENVFIDTEDFDKQVLEFEAKTILTKMGFTDFSLNAKTLSGGERKRVCLAKVLVSSCDVLILDEPTNHLDSEMILWLEDYLKRFSGAVIMVTHDRYFLDRVVNKIVELDEGLIYTYVANYSKFLELKEQREESLVATKRKNKSLYKKELEWAMRGPRGRGTKSTFRLSRLENLDKGDLNKNAKMEINSAISRLGKKTIEINNISKSYGDRVIIKDFTYIIDRNDRVGIIGKNGMGKSTLMKLITGQISPDEGSIDFGDTVKIGFVSQDFEMPDEDMRVIDYIKDVAEYIETDNGTLSASNMLDTFLFDDDAKWNKIKKLSGGEKRRLNLLRVLMGAPNLLFLDEPTNDLDILTLSVLEDYLETFTGAVITISHDRYFLDKVVDTIFEFQKDGTLKKYNGGYSDYIEAKTQSNTDTINGKDDISQTSKNNKNDNRKRSDEKLKFTYNEKREFETIDEDLEKQENEISKINEEIEKQADNYEELIKLSAKKEELEKILEEKMERWVYLNDLNDKINNSVNK